MINKRNLTLVGSILAIVLFAAGIAVMASGLVELPSVPSNTTLPSDATTVVTVLETTASAATTQPSVDVIAQSTALKPYSDNKNDEGQVVDPSVQLLSKTDVIAIAQAQVGVGTVIEIELDREDNPPLYDIKLIAGGYKYELKVHAVTGALLDLEKERIESTDDSADD